MHILGKNSFVLETYIPETTGKNKQVVDQDTGQLVTVPDGEVPYRWHWFAGVGLHPESAAKGQMVWMNIWTPYPSQAAQYKDRDEAKAVRDKVLNGDKSVYVEEWKTSHHALGLQVIIPVSGVIPDAGKSKSGIDGKGHL